MFAWDTQRFGGICEPRNQPPICVSTCKREQLIHGVSTNTQINYRDHVRLCAGAIFDTDAHDLNHTCLTHKREFIVVEADEAVNYPIVHLDTDCFASGQFYIAFSRVDKPKKYWTNKIMIMKYLSSGFIATSKSKNTKIYKKAPKFARRFPIESQACVFLTTYTPKLRL